MPIAALAKKQLVKKLGSQLGSQKAVKNLSKKAVKNSLGVKNSLKKLIKKPKTNKSTESTKGKGEDTASTKEVAEELISGLERLEKLHATLKWKRLPSSATIACSFEKIVEEFLLKKDVIEEYIALDEGAGKFKTGQWKDEKENEKEFKLLKMEYIEQIGQTFMGIGFQEATVKREFRLIIGEDSAILWITTSQEGPPFTDLTLCHEVAVFESLSEGETKYEAYYGIETIKTTRVPFVMAKVESHTTAEMMKWDAEVKPWILSRFAKNK